MHNGSVTELDNVPAWKAGVAGAIRHERSSRSASALASVVDLVDTLRSGRSAIKSVRVRLPPDAQIDPGQYVFGGALLLRRVRGLIEDNHSAG